MRRLLSTAACLVGFVSLRGIASAQTAPPDAADAIALHRAATSVGSTKSERELAQYRLAIALYRLELHQGAYAIFAAIADDPKHARYSETLRWLAKLTLVVPEPADIVERIGRYDDTEIAQLDNVEQRALFWQLEYLLGRYKYQDHQYEIARALFAKVERRSKHYLTAQFFSGMASTQLRRPLEATQAFERIVVAVDAGEDFVEATRTRDLALLSLARIHYSMSTREDARGLPAVDPGRLATAMKYWSMVDVSGEHWLDALFEQSWGYFMLGDHARALGNLHIRTLDDLGGDDQPEAAILRSLVYLANCQYDDAATLGAQFHQKYESIAAGLAALLRSQRDGDEDAPFYVFLKEVRDGKAKVPPHIAPAVQHALGDRQLLRHLHYVQVLDAEQKRFSKMPDGFRASGLGGTVEDTLVLARNIAIRNAGRLTRERLQRAHDELRRHLAESARILATAIAGRRSQPDASLTPWRIPARDAERNVVRAGEGHDGVLWPFNGELWSDEPVHRQSIRSVCK